MRERKWGRVLVVGSTGMQHPIPNLALSNTLRAAVWGWLKTYSGEAAPDGVTMNVIAPGTILTGRIIENATAPAPRRRARRGAGQAAEVPAGRLGLPAEFGPMAASWRASRPATSRVR